MTKHDAWLFAASWGSMIRAGDPGACMYGFDADFRMQSEAHRADVLREMAGNRARVVARPDDYEPGELAQIDLFIERAKAAKLADEPDALTAAPGADDFARGYVEALIWANTEQGCESVREWEADAADDASGSALPEHVTADDFDPVALADCLADCAAFQAKAGELLAAAYAQGYTATQAGRDFYFTRSGHGVGFSDRDELEPDDSEYEALTAVMVAASKSGDNAAWDKACAARNALEEAGLAARLTAVAKTFGEAAPYLGDSGLVYIA